MSSFELTPVETRVLGCLIEKERLTPENYPLSLNSLTAACNQSTNREPVVAYDEKTVEAAVNALREKKLGSVVFGAGSRVQKYRHKLLEHYELTPAEVALMCTLLLRGPQTPGELRSRSERMHAFESVAEVEARLEELGRGSAPLVRALEARPGQKERRFVQLLSAEMPEAEATPHTLLAQEAAPAIAPLPTRIDTLTAEIATLRTELEQLREEFRAFRKQFE
jgi:uncharacterized protein YceH (UPF0502 family)